MPTILHLSDLHRTSGPRLHNDELVAAIVSDSGRWDTEGIPRPDVIVVSGDLVQGSAPGCVDPDAELAAQYVEADDLLRRMADEFVDGDLYRVVVVPGNHDVSWSRARMSMAELTTCPDNIQSLATEPDSRVRWDWRTQRALEITDVAAYDSRLEAFRDFRQQLYSGLTPSPLDGDRDLVFFDYRDLDLAIVGFSSWYGNDCFCRVGEIDLRLLARSRELLATSGASVAVGVWHHSLVGGPRSDDYMDQRVVHRMIDFGFSVGLHGHQHSPGAAPYELSLPNKTAMVVVSAGSLAVGDRELPMGERRQFNIVVLDPSCGEVTVHVRGMSGEGVFMGSHRDDFGGHTYITLPLQHSPARPKPPSAVTRLDDAIRASAAGDHTLALELLAFVPETHSVQKRQVEIEALAALHREEEILALLDPPQSADEVVRAVAMLLERSDFDAAQQRLEASRRLLDPATASELDTRIKVGRMAS